jgi:outer membrane receptor protein involved in Fe transport
MFRAASGVALLAVLGAAGAARAQTGGSATAEQATTVGEVVVTASRRAETVSKLPFNVSAIAGQQLERANVSDMAALTRQVPNFSMEDTGPKGAVSSIPIIRGLNASQPVTNGARYFQSPVGFYLGNAPETGFYPLFDIERVEVLRGPQGTLYGAGALSGAVRIVPAEPKLESFSGFVSASDGLVAHSKAQSYSVSGAVNVPIGDSLALRLNAKQQRDAGFIDQHDILARENGDYVSGAPVLANPGDVANSPGVYFDKRDANWAETTSARAALRFEPTDAFSMTLAYNYSYAKGVGSNLDDPTFEGGPSPLDPRITLRGTGRYERSLPMLEPWERRSELATLDASYDLGFATLSTTVAYGKTRGKMATDDTVTLLGTPYGVYYTGSPANPRAVIPVTNPDSDRSYTEEIRLVSKTGGQFDYVVGAFFQQQRRFLGLTVWDPGADVQSAAANGGSTLPLAAGGTYVQLFPDNSAYVQATSQDFKDYSVYGDLTWHLTDQWQVTGGARAFHQSFRQQIDAASSFFFFAFDNINQSKTNDQIFKLNTSYQLDPSNQVYATWSQGFRRGGANAFQLTGPLQEPRVLLEYQPDKTNNFEAGFKGTIGGIYYAADVFYIAWDKPQIDLYTPYLLTPVVVNAEEAASKGFEFEASGPIGDSGLSFNLGVAYAKARLTKDFSLPAGDGAGNAVPDAIHGAKGDRLPGAPDWSGAVNLTYKHDAGELGRITYALGMDFRSSTVNQLSSYSANAPTRRAAGYALFNGSIVLEHGDWQAELYGTNLADKYVVYARNFRTLSSYATMGDYGNAYAVARPREIGIRLTRRW